LLTNENVEEAFAKLNWADWAKAAKNKLTNNVATTTELENPAACFIMHRRVHNGG
jgi:L-ribulose-5-phosphate 3-epimerase UlaE